jgi:hypothetical protein
MSHDLEALWFIERACRDGDALAPLLFKKQAGATLNTEAATKSRDRDIPFECIRFHQGERASAACRRSHEVPARSPALDTMACDHVAQWTSHFVPHPTALTPARDDLIHNSLHTARRSLIRSGAILKDPPGRNKVKPRREP